MQNGVMQENRIKLEVKGSIDAVGNISTDNHVYSRGIIGGDSTTQVDICASSPAQKVLIQYPDGMYSFMRYMLQNLVILRFVSKEI